MILPFHAPESIVIAAPPTDWASSSLSKNHRVAATLATDGMVQIWNVAPSGMAFFRHQFKTPSLLDLPSSGRGTIAVSPDGTYVAIARPYAEYSIWSVVQKKRITSLANPEYEAELAWLPSGKGVLCTVHSSRGLQTKRLDLNGQTRSLPVSDPWFFTPDGRSVIAPIHDVPTLVDLQTGKVWRRFRDSIRSMTPYAISKDGKYLVTMGEDPSWTGPGEGPDGNAPMESAYIRQLTLKTWQIADGRRIRVQPGYISDAQFPKFTFADERQLVLPEMGDVIDIRTGKRIAHREPDLEAIQGLQLAPLPKRPLVPRPVQFPQPPITGRSLAIFPDGRILK